MEFNKNDTNKLIYKTETTHRSQNQTYSYQRKCGGGGGGVINWEIWINLYTLCFAMLC